MKIEKFKFSLIACLAVLLASPHGGCGEADPSIPPALAEWKEKAYAQRYFLKVEAPGEAGNVNVLGDAPAASVILPLKMIDPGLGAARPETLLLIGEDGLVQSLLARQVPESNQVEIAFATRPGLRRFCLYAGAAAGANPPSSSTSFQTQALRVKLRGRTIPQDLAYTENSPLTLDRFLKIEERGEFVLGNKQTSNLDDPECPFFFIAVDQSGHVTRQENPQRYGALYEALLRAPVTGSYKFALDTMGAAHVLIDGRPVITADKPDPARAPLALTGSADLNEGIHRVTVYYAEAGTEQSKTNANLGRFGLRLHWQPPCAQTLLCIPAQAFPRALPAVVSRYEVVAAGPQPFIHIENLGQVRVALHRGESAAREYVQLFARMVGVPPGAKLQLVAPDLEHASASHLCSWVPAGADIGLSIVAADGNVLATRTLSFPTKAKGARDVMDLEAELAMKSAQEFIYPDENSHIHFETLLSPAPVIVSKERTENKYFPPPPRPMGEFKVTWQTTAATEAPPPNSAAAIAPQVFEATPVDGTRKKSRATIAAGAINDLAREGRHCFVLQLTVGDAPVEATRFRLLHSQSAHWPGTLVSGVGQLLFEAGDAKKKEPPAAKPGAGAQERVMIVLPRESEREYRRFSVLKAISSENVGDEALFIGDPLVEGANAPAAPPSTGGEKPEPDPKKLTGLAERVASGFDKYKWSAVQVPGPHRYLPVFRILAGAEQHIQSLPAGKMPGLVVVSLGGGDVARQTPLHTFERALDALIDRLRLAGAKKILVLGAIPEPMREKQCAPYQERLLDLLRQHHIDSVDIFNAWTKESDWLRRFCLDGAENAPLYGPVPNSQSLDDIVKLLKERM